MTGKVAIAETVVAQAAAGRPGRFRRKLSKAVSLGGHRLSEESVEVREPVCKETADGCGNDLSHTGIFEPDRHTPAVRQFIHTKLIPSKQVPRSKTRRPRRADHEVAQVAVRQAPSHRERPGTNGNDLHVSFAFKLFQNLR